MRRINWLLLFDKVLKKIGLSRASVTRYYAWAEKKNRDVMLARIADLVEAREQIKSLRAQLVNIRVAQAERPRMGWEVMCYIPDEILANMSVASRDLCEDIASNLVFLALSGIINVTKMGRCNALIFSPLDINKPVEQSKWVVGLFERGGQFTISEKAHAKIEKLEDEKKLYREFKPYKPTE